MTLERNGWITFFFIYCCTSNHTESTSTTIIENKIYRKKCIYSRCRSTGKHEWHGQPLRHSTSIKHSHSHPANEMKFQFYSDHLCVFCHLSSLLVFFSCSDIVSCLFLCGDTAERSMRQPQTVHRKIYNAFPPFRVCVCVCGIRVFHFLAVSFHVTFYVGPEYVYWCKSHEVRQQFTQSLRQRKGEVTRTLAFTWVSLFFRVCSGTASRQTNATDRKKRQVLMQLMQ